MPARNWSNLTFLSSSKSFYIKILGEININFKPSAFVKQMKLNGLQIFAENQISYEADMAREQSRYIFGSLIVYCIPMV